MRIANIFILTIFSSCLAVGAAQAPSAAGPAQPLRTTTTTAPTDAAPAAAPVAPVAPAPSSLLQPSLDSLRQTLSGVKVERWKRGSVRDEASADMNSLMTDIQQRMPGLLKDADAAPGALSKALPVSRHVDALYDVLLRVVEAARMAAPDDQANQLRNALNNLEKARLALDDSMEQNASSQEKQLVDLRGTVQKQAAFKCPAPPPAPVCPKPEVKKPVRKKPAATPATGTAPNGPSGATTQKPAAGQPANATQQKPAANGTTTKPNPQAQKPQQQN